MGSHKLFCKNKQPGFGPAAPPNVSVVLSAGNQTLLSFLADRKSSDIVIKRIPKGARTLCAQSFSKVLKKCMDDNGSQAWEVLFKFAFRAFAISKNASERETNLTSYIKKKSEMAAEGTEYSPETMPIRKRKPKKLSCDYLLRKCVESKIQDGDISGAIRALTSDAAVAEYNETTLASLRLKHPSGFSPDAAETFLTGPTQPQTALQNIPRVSSSEVLRAVFSFPSGSAGGMDGLRPQHLKDMLGKRDDTESVLCDALKAFADFVIAGKVPLDLRPFLFSATLVALKKKDGGIRPIAVGSTLRRVVAKIISARIQDRSGELFRPVQLGFGTKGGAEAIVHAARRFLTSSPTDAKVFVKLDFKNAFNCVYRDKMISCVETHFPNMQSFCGRRMKTRVIYFLERIKFHPKEELSRVILWDLGPFVSLPSLLQSL